MRHLVSIAGDSTRVSTSRLSLSCLHRERQVPDVAALIAHVAQQRWVGVVIISRLGTAAHTLKQRVRFGLHLADRGAASLALVHSAERIHVCPFSLRERDHRRFAFEGRGATA